MKLEIDAERMLASEMILAAIWPWDAAAKLILDQRQRLLDAGTPPGSVDKVLSTFLEDEKRRAKMIEEFAKAFPDMVAEEGGFTVSRSSNLGDRGSRNKHETVILRVMAARDRAVQNARAIAQASSPNVVRQRTARPNAPANGGTQR